MIRKQTFPLNMGWRTLLSDLGLRPDAVLRRARLPPDLFSRPEQGLSTGEYFGLWCALEAESGDPLFPLRIVEAVSTEAFDPPLFAALCSANLLQAARRLATYKQLMMPMALEVELGPRGELLLTPRWLLAQGDVPLSLQVAEIAFFVRLARLATREPVNALRVVLPALPQPAQARGYEDFFGVALRRGPRPCIAFSAVDAQRPFLTANEAMWRVFEPALGQRLSELQARATTAERVRALLLELLPGNAATIEAVASQLALSKRTLQRRLEAEGENFRGLVNGTREELARHYLAQTRLSGGEIAFLLGFEDPNSFYRAFHEWTGQTPEALRQGLRLN